MASEADMLADQVNAAKTVMTGRLRIDCPLPARIFTIAETFSSSVTIPRQSRGLSICEPLKAAIGVATRPLFTRHLKVAVQRHISI
jgi:hypothetical protein